MQDQVLNPDADLRTQIDHIGPRAKADDKMNVGIGNRILSHRVFGDYRREKKEC
jgi:hypothetical protein